MIKNHEGYSGYASDNLSPGSKLAIERTIFSDGNTDISKLTALSAVELQSMRDKSIEAENSIFEKLCESAGEWETQAGNTLLIDRALDYIQTPSVNHSANQWQKNDYGNDEISNRVYKMYVQVREETKYNRETKESEPVAWYVSWTVRTNSPSREYNKNIAGQDRKRFTDKAMAEKYIAGRKSAYANLFEDLSPPIPKELVRSFIVNNQLLPGYTIQGESQEKKPSVMDKLTAAKDAAAKASPPKDSAEKKPPSHDDR